MRKSGVVVQYEITINVALRMALKLIFTVISKHFPKSSGAIRKLWR